jgi:hemolysin activation/secretion protein
LALNYQVSPENTSQTNVLYATYLWRFAGSDEVVSIYGIRSNSDVAVVGSSTILGNSKIAGARWIIPVGSSFSDATSFFHSFTLGLDRKDFAQTDVSIQSADLTVLPPITYYPLSLNYGLTVVDAVSTKQLSLGFVTAPRDVFGNTDAKFQSRRVLGGASFVSWKLDTSLEQNLSKSWGTYLHLTGQWTFDPLIPNEQFVTGGSTSVRGYRESEISGDRGAQGSLELRYFPLGHPGPDGKRGVYLCAFADGAQARLVDPAGPQISIITIASSGLGLHAREWYGLYTSLDVAKALKDGGEAVKGPITPKGTWRIEAALGYAF